MSIANLGAVQTGAQALSGVQAQFNMPRPTAVGLGEGGGIAFQDLLGAYMGILGDAGRAEQHYQHLQVEFALGNHDDMLSVIMAQEMAITSVNFAVQITSRIIEAYREIMRMQI